MKGGQKSMDGGLLTSGGGLAGIDVADNDDVDVETIFLTVDAESVSRSTF